MPSLRRDRRVTTRRTVRRRTRSSGSTWFPRLLGVATAGYGAAVLARPSLLTDPMELGAADGSVPVGTEIGVRALGGRDVASGLAMAFAPAGPALRTAIAVRVLADATDVGVLGALAPTADARTKGAGVAAAWGTLCALSYLAAGE